MQSELNKFTGMKIMTISLVIITLLIGSSCKKPLINKKYGFDIKNNSEYPINYYVAGLGMEFIYPDTTLLSKEPSMPLVNQGESLFWGTSYKLEDFFKELPNDTLSVYIFISDTIARYNWTTIRSEYKVSKRYDLSLSDLKKSNFVIIYP